MILWGGREGVAYAINNYRLAPGGAFDVGYAGVTGQATFTADGPLSLTAAVKLAGGSVINLTTGAVTGTVNSGGMVVKNIVTGLPGAIAETSRLLNSLQQMPEGHPVDTPDEARQVAYQLRRKHATGRESHPDKAGRGQVMTGLKALISDKDGMLAGNGALHRRAFNPACKACSVP